MKSLFALIFAFAAGAASTEVVNRVAAAQPVAVSTASTLTVSEFLEQPDKRKAAWARCANDPGHTQGDPECINARTAEMMAMAGSGRVRFNP